MVRLMTRRSTRQIVFVALLAALGGFGLAALFRSLSDPAAERSTPQIATAEQRVAERAAEQPAQRAAEQPAARAREGEARSGAEAKGDERSGSSVAELFGAGDGAIFRPHEPWTATVPRILLRLLLATALAAMLAFRPRKQPALLQRNLYVAQTQILMAVVASALMMIVGDSAARAFGIFAAASLVRFRTNIRDPKEITVLLVNLALGLATGVGRWDVALVLALFMLPLLWFLEHREEEQVFRAMALTVRTRDTVLTQEALRRVFRRFRMTAEVRQLDPPSDGEPLGCITYYVKMNLGVSTDEVSEEIRAADAGSVESIEWEQQKSRDYIYQ